jgi:hypothetical protein
MDSEQIQEQEKILFNYACAMTARGLNKDELSLLTRAKNEELDAPLDGEKVGGLIESAFIFKLEDDIDINLPTITGAKRQLAPLLDDIYDSLQPDPTLFRHGEGLVSVRDGAIGHYTPDTVATLLSRRANYVDTRQGGMFPPPAAAKAVLYSLGDGDRIRPLERVVNVPVLRKDGTVLNSPGYGTISGLFYHPTGDIPEIQPDPAQESAVKAAGWLLDMLCDFPFGGDADRANYTGLLLTLVVREMCDCVPLALIDAPAAGTGKSLLAKIAAIAATGGMPEFGVIPGDEAEMRKGLTSKLQESPPVLIYDNVDDVIRSAALATAITSVVWQDRLLGRNRVLHLPMRAVLIVTGNNVRLGGDMPRRCYRVRIDANAAQPWARGSFKHTLPEYASENRGRIIAALLVMARAWIIAGHPAGGNKPLGGFESWTKTVGGILEFAGVSGFLGNLQEMYRDTADGDDDAEQWAAWMDAIHVHFGENAFTVKELAEAINGYSAMKLKDDAPYSLGEIGTANDRAWLTRLGLALHTRKGQVFRLGESLLKLCQGIADPRSGKKHYWLDKIK